MEWESIIFGVLGLAFLALIIQAIRQMSMPLDDGGDARETDEQRQEDGTSDEADRDSAGAPGDDDLGDALDTELPTEKKPTEKKPSKKEKRKLDKAEEKARLRKGLAKTRGGFIARLGSLFSKKRILDEEMLDQIEEILFTADIGVRTSQDLIDSLRDNLGKKEIKDASVIWDHIRHESARILDRQGAGTLDVEASRPFVILVIGVNGTGKTTTIGKLAARFKEDGHHLLLAAADTFRAAAVEQLEVWGKRAGVQVVKGKEGADPSSVIVDALDEAKKNDVDVVIVDTAGRLHTKADLMDELKKIGRTISKRIDGGPHETILVLDATMGQNAIAQARIFKEAMDITGLILTKLDGTAKGGVVLGICNELQLPVRFIGIGEKAEDLRVFDPESFAHALYEAADNLAETSADEK